MISSRALGRHLQSIPLEADGTRSNALAALKAWYVNLYGFCEAHSALFTVEHAVDQEDVGFFLRLTGSKDAAEASEGMMQASEEAAAGAEGIKLRRRWKKLKEDELGPVTAKEGLPQPSTTAAATGSSDPNSMKVVDLKNLLRGLGLPLSGTKKELLERLADHQRGEMYSWSNRSD
jgi:hypothetical protein